MMDRGLELWLERERERERVMGAGGRLEAVTVDGAYRAVNERAAVVARRDLVIFGQFACCWLSRGATGAPVRPHHARPHAHAAILTAFPASAAGAAAAAASAAAAAA